MRREKIRLAVEEYTKEMLKNKLIGNNGIDADTISAKLKLDRANVSRELNFLWQKGNLIKIQGRPVLFVDYRLLTIEYPNCYIPSTISKNSSLLDYINKVNSKEKTEFKHIKDSRQVIIGANGSLRNEVQKATAAINYPPYGLPILIVGDAGTGKRKFAEHIFYYSIESKLRAENASFIIINCSDYANSDELFRKMLFGAAKTSTSKSVKGLIESSNNGVIYFDDIHKLSNKSINMVKDMITKDSFSRIGENIERHLETTIMASITTEENEDISYSIKECFPVLIRLPDFSARNSFEKIEIILSLFSREAFNTKETLVINKSVIYLFASYNYKENETQLRNEIKTACSKAFINRTAEKESIEIGFNHLSDDLLANKNQDEILSRILAMYKNEQIVIKQSGECDALDFYRNIQDRFTYTNLQSFINQFNIDVNNIDNYDEYIYNTTDVLLKLDDEHYNEIYNHLNPSVEAIFNKHIEKHIEYKNLYDNRRIMSGLILMLGYVSSNQKKIINTTPLSYSYQHDFEYKTIKEINKELIAKNEGKLSELECEFFTEFIFLANKILENTSISILVIAHGKYTASELIENAKDTANNYNVALEAINYSKDIQFNDLLELAHLAINRLNKGNGVLIMIDSYPLNGIEEKLKKECDTKLKVVSSLSLENLLSAIEYCGKYKVLDNFHDSYKNDKQIKNNKTSENEFINMLINDVLSKTLLYVNPKRATDALIFSLHLILDKLNMPYEQSIAVKYVSHGLHMIERVVIDAALPYYQLKQFRDNNHALMDTISESLETIENIFDIHIPDSELAYLSEIFLEYLEEK